MDTEAQASGPGMKADHRWLAESMWQSFLLQPEQPSVDEGKEVTYTQGVKMNVIAAHRCAYQGRSVASLTVLVYMALVVLAASCVSMPVGSSERHDHHDAGGATHSSLCAWACQSTADATAVSGPVPTVTEVMFGPSEISTHQLVSSAPDCSDRTRAPPTPLLVSLV